MILLQSCLVQYLLSFNHRLVCFGLVKVRGAPVRLTRPLPPSVSSRVCHRTASRLTVPAPASPHACFAACDPCLSLGAALGASCGTSRLRNAANALSLRDGAGPDYIDYAIVPRTCICFQNF